MRQCCHRLETNQLTCTANQWFNGLTGNFISLSFWFYLFIYLFFCENAMKIIQVSIVTEFVLKAVWRKSFPKTTVSVLDLFKAILDYSPFPLLSFTWSFVPGT